MASQKNRLDETVLLSTQKHMFQLMGRKIITILRSKNVRNWTYVFQVRVWDSGSGQRTQSLSTGGITLDTCSLMVNQHMFLATLSEKKLNLFKWC